MKIHMGLGVLVLLLLLTNGALWAGDITGGATTAITTLKTFAAGNPASAGEVNQNFALVRDAVNDNDARLDALAAGGVTSAHIADGAVTSADIAADTITAADIAAGAVGTSEIADGTITTTDILDSTITSADIAADTITAADIAADAVGASEIAAGAVGTSEIADGTVSSTDILDGTITSADIAADTITAANIGTGAVGTAEILDGTITAADIAAEPGIEYSDVSGYGTQTAFPTSNSTFASVSVTAPAAGYVFVVATGEIYIPAAKYNNYTYLGLDTSESTTIPAYGRNVIKIYSESNVYAPTCVSFTFSVSAGTTYTYYLRGYSDVASSIYYLHQNLAAMFFPTRY